jgi:malonyl-CoA/methylmalonyl-CoA synthetase
MATKIPWAATIPAMTQSLTQQLHDAFVTHAERPCLQVPGGRDWSYAELGGLSARLAGVLGAVGVSAGDRVLVQVDKSPEAVALYLACLQVGAAYVPINTAYTSAEVDYFIGDAQPGLFVCRPADEAVLKPLCAGAAVLTLGTSADGSLLARAGEVDPITEVAAPAGSDIAAILYTSGTTGRSKGAMLTQQNLLSNALTLLDYWGWQDDDVLLHALPVFHVHGLFVALHCAFLSGTPVLFLPGFNADAVLASLPHATVMMGVPTFYTRLLDHPEFNAEVCGNMRLFISGSAPLTEQTFRAWEARTGLKILERYGMSETAMITSNPLLGERVAGTVGFALPGIETRIADEAGRALPAEEVGIIEVRGPNVFKGYWQMPEKTAEEFRDDGFFVTGDMGRMDSEGRISIVGRAKDLVISGGYNVYPKEVEKLIDEIPGVVESAVIGVPHPDFGEGVVAVVVPAADEVSEADVGAALEGKLARFKQPKRVMNVAELPRNAMGKVQKNDLRQRFEALFE